MQADTSAYNKENVRIACFGGGLWNLNQVYGNIVATVPLSL